MPNFTKNAIKTEFLRLLDEKPLSQITVKNICHLIGNAVKRGCRKCRICNMRQSFIY